MRPCFLIAGNYLREQRWLLVVLVGWVVGSSAVAASSTPIAMDDVLFFLKQQAMYGVAFTVFLAASSIHAERKSRRILAVLSKGITRTQYLGGLIFGVGGAALIYCVAMAAAGAVVFRSTRVPQPGAWIVIVLVLTSSLLSACISMLFSTIGPPLFSALATGGVLGIMAFGARALPAWGVAFPIYGTVEAIMAFGVATRLSWAAMAPLIAASLIEAAIAWTLARAIFAYRDIAVPIE